MTCIPKVVVFDLDETLGYFSQLGLFWNILKEYSKRDLNQNDFNRMLNLYPEFIRPNIITLLTFLKYKKKRNKCNGVMIYTNNQGPREWSSMIKEYFHEKLKYPLFDQIISAFKVNGKIIEVGRTTHDKCLDDFIRCTKIPENTQICFLDDIYHSGMTGENVYYINLKPYVYHLSFDEILDKFLNSPYSINILEKDASDFELWFRESAKHSSFNYIEKSKEEYEIDKIVTKKTMLMLQDFFNKYTQDANSRKHRTKTKKSTTLKKR